MKKRLLRTCAGILAAMMLMETAFAGNMSARVYADEIDEVVDELNSEIIDETLTDEVQTLSSKEEIPEEDINVTEEEIQEEETVVSEEALNGGETITCSIYFDTVGGTLATNKERLTETRYDVESVSGTKTIREIINGSFAFEAGETIETVYIPFKPNYGFEGWFDKDGNEFNFNATLAESVDDDGKIVAYAKWLPTKGMTAPEISIKGYPTVIHDYDVLKIESAEPGAMVYYSINDSNVKEVGTHYYGEKTIKDLIGDVTSSTSFTVYAYAVKNGCVDAFSSASFDVEPDWGDITEEQQSDLFGDDFASVPKGMWTDGVSDHVDYTGKAITFKDLKVYYGVKLLTEGKHYQISYVNNVKAYWYEEGDKYYDEAKVPAVVITGLGSFSKTYKEYFLIDRIDIENVTFTGCDVKYDGAQHKLTPIGTYKNKTLVNGTDFKIVYSSPSNTYTKIGEYDIEITGKGNFYGTRTLTERITKYSFDQVSKPIGVCDLEFNPEYSEGDPERYWVHSDMGKNFQITRGSTPLKYGVDYDMSYPEKAPKIGTTKVTIYGIGDYSGEFIMEYRIIAPSSAYYVDIGKSYINNFQEEVMYGTDLLGTDQSGTMEVWAGKGQTLLQYNNDYVIDLKDGVKGVDNVNVGEVTIVIKANKSPFYGEKELTFKIVPRPINNKEVDIVYGYSATLSGGVAENTVNISYKGITLVEGVDYKLSYVNNTHTFSSNNLTKEEYAEKRPTVTITGIGNYSGSTKRYFAIDGDNFDTVRVNACDKIYEAKADNYKTSFDVTDVKGNVLVKGTDYAKKYSYYYVDETLLDNGEIRHPGELVHEGDMVPYDTWMRVEITPKGSYERIVGYNLANPVYGTVSATYKITRYTIESAEVIIPSQCYTGYPITLNKNQLLVKVGSRYLADNEYEIVGYTKNKNVGTATVTIRGIANYGGQKTVNFTISKEKLGGVIAFNRNGAEGGNMSAQSVTSYIVDKKYVKLTKNVFTRANYKFLGWNTESDGSGESIADAATLYSISDLIDEGKVRVLYAQWEPKVYKITVYKNGGTFDDSLIPSTYTPETAIEPYPVPDSSTWPRGYMFGGWFKDSAFTTRVLRLTHGSSGDIKLYAKWIPYTYTIKYNPNYSTKTKMADSVVSYGQEKALRENTFKRSGYAFMGWSLDQNETRAEFKNSMAVSHKDLKIKEENNINQVVELYAIWQKVFTVDFDPNGGDAVSSITYTYGTSKSLPVPKRTGYTFSGWYTNAEFTKKVDSITSTKKSDYNLVAKWTANKYTIAFDKNNKNATGTMSALSMKYDTTKAITKNKFIRKGYKFVGWSTKKDGTGIFYTDQDAVQNLTSKSAGKVTLYAQWTPTSYTITYDGHGGTIDGFAPDEYNYGQALSLPIATKTGYKFGGWYKEDTYKTKVKSITSSQYGNLSLHAKWISESTDLAGRHFPITVVGVDSSEWNGAVIPDEYIYGTAFSFPSGANVPTRDGYTFSGWYKDSAFSKKITGVGAKTYDDLKVYAKWTAKSYKVKYKLNIPAEVNPKTVTGKETSSTFKYGKSTALKKNGYKIKGYSFKGWALTEDGPVVFENGATVAGEPDGEGWKYESTVYLYAVWEMNTYTIKYMNMANIHNANPYTYNVFDKITLISPSQVGRTFQGWYTDPEFINKVKGYEAGTTGNKTLYAKWKQNAYNFTYILNDSDDPNTEYSNGLVGYVTNYFKLANNGHYVLPSVSRKGYKFKGWSTTKEGENPVFSVKPSGSVETTYYATWETIKYKIEYDYGYKEKGTDKANKLVEKTYSISKKEQALMVPVRYGYVFEGWHVGSLDGPEKEVIDIDEVGDLKLYTSWHPLTYTAKFSLNGVSGTAPGDKKDIFANKNWTIPTQIYLWEGHTFVGWEFNGKTYAPGDTVNAQKLGIYTDNMDVTFTAVWR